jgi:hypothetical protein
LAVLLLGLWVALAPAVFAMPAAAMTVHTTIAGDADADGCEGCTEPEQDRRICALICLNAAQSAVLAEPGKLPAQVHDGREPPGQPVLAGRLPAPEPTPPKAVSPL